MSRVSDRAHSAYPWAAVPKVKRRDIALLRALGGGTPSLLRPLRSPVLGGLDVMVGGPRVVDHDELRAHLADRLTAVARLRRGDLQMVDVVVPSVLARVLADRIFRVGPREIPLPRPVTWAERGVVAYVVAALVEASGLAGWMVEASELTAAALGRALAPGPYILAPLRVSVDGLDTGALLLAPASVVAAAPVRRPLGELMAARGGWLERAPITAGVLSGSSSMMRAELMTLRPRDVLLLERLGEAGSLAFGRGRAAIALDRSAGRVMVEGSYERGMPMSERCADDVTVEVSCRLGSVSMSARQVLELAPGQILPLDRPLGGPVDILCGSTVIGRGELVDIEGELGVRVVELELS